MKKSILRSLCIAIALSSMLAPAVAEQELDLLLVDRKLYELGYRDEACNGQLDTITVNALKSFQRANGLEVNGEPDAATVELLMSGNGKTEREYLSALAYKYNETSQLAKGSYGDDVTRLQKALKKLGYFRSENDGAYGDATEAAVYRFQLANGLMETGIADGSTQLRLYEGQPVKWDDFLNESCASTGESGDHVRRLQLRLKDMGYFTGKCSGRYGEGTQQAVFHFQSMNNLDATGDVDLATCKLLYSKSAIMLTDAQSLHRGSSGAEAEKLCRRLQELGYPAADTFNTQTEIALLQFQLANRLDATGVLDNATSGRLNGNKAVSYDVETWRSHAVSMNEETCANLVKAATAKLGAVPEVNSSFQFVQYMHLRSGVPLMDEAQMEMVLMDDVSRAQAGDTLLVNVDGHSFYGIATADGAVIYRTEEGYVVMSYLGMLDSHEVYIWQKGSSDGD